MSEPGGALVRRLLHAAGSAIEREKDRLSALDGAIGDGDHGVTMSIGFRAMATALDALPEPASATDVLNAAAKSFLSAVGASAGPLYATALMRAGAALKGVDTVDGPACAQMVKAMANGIEMRGKAAAGDKTMLDAWMPAADAAERAADGSVADVLRAAADAAATGAEATRDLEARKGRAARLGSRSVGHIDPGAASTAVILAAMAEAAD